ncbi:MAG: PUR family DNA/RNA-binding protein [Termitinemataceae bacterium]|nr:MAG: PUR family DNA/RNA-binding protein [Termitinemataceae bacterium]
MGVRGEVFSTTVSLPNRTYFFNVKENRLGDLYLNIVESKNKEGGGFERQSVILFADDLQAFLKGFDESLRVMEKNVREKKRVPRGGGEPIKGKPVRDGKKTFTPKEKRTGSAAAGSSGKKTERVSGHPEKWTSRPKRTVRVKPTH